MMELHLTFQSGEVTGTGRDLVGDFTFQGRYSVADGSCHWIKQYTGKHDVTYKGYAEGKGIWGVWEMAPELAPTASHGGFHIWPQGIPDPTKPTLAEEMRAPVEIEVEPLVGAAVVRMTPRRTIAKGGAINYDRS